MQTIRHSYSPAWFMRSYTTLFNISGFVNPPLFFLYLLITIGASTHPITLVNIVIFFLLAILLGLVSILAGNLMTEIVSDEVGLHVNFLWKHLFVPYKDIIEVKSYSSSPFSKRKNIKVIRTRSLTPLHRLYDLFFSFSLYPSIVYNEHISDYDELTQRIEKSLQENKKM